MSIFVAILLLPGNHVSATEYACESQIFCQGDLLRDIQLARPFKDSKTFVDLPTTRPVLEVLEAYRSLIHPITNDSALRNFLEENFGLPGQELRALRKPPTPAPDFLAHINSSIIRDFADQVIDIWPELTREVDPANQLCPGCESSFIAPLRPFVVAGGRFREIYYWDTFFILEGLLRTKGDFTVIARNMLHNLLDLIETYGFVPNGGRKYYLNRSQPPLLCEMLHIYLLHTNDSSILNRALPLLLKEQQYFDDKSIMLNVTGQRGHLGYRYITRNNQPRPEAYVEDYETANNKTYTSANGTIYRFESLTSDEQDRLYQNIASATESGWDFSSRWLAESETAVTDSGFALRSTNIVHIIPVDLQALQSNNAWRISTFYHYLGNESASSTWSKIAEQRETAMIAINYNATLQGYFDYNLTSGRQNTDIPTDAGPQSLFSPAQFYPLAFGANKHRTRLSCSTTLKSYSIIKEQLAEFPGGVATSSIHSGQQWDQPNVWPPLQYVLIKGLLASLPDTQDAAFDPECDAVYLLAREIAQRYVDSTYCTWRATGGSHPSLGIAQAPGFPVSARGMMFEKYSNMATNAIGEGGEYETVEGFGWTNGVLIWIVDNFGESLVTPMCDLTFTAVSRSEHVRSDALNGLSFQ